MQHVPTYQKSRPDVTECPHEPLDLSFVEFFPKLWLEAKEMLQKALQLDAQPAVGRLRSIVRMLEKLHLHAHVFIYTNNMSGATGNADIQVHRLLEKLP